ncbi:MAG: tRNA adenosine(34) deaminase TadA [Clostridia bacterium]
MQSAEKANEFYMKEALKEAKKAAKKLESPIGAVLVYKGEIIARAHNNRETTQSALGHAELEVIRKGCKKLASWRLCDCTLYVTLEPCAMCAGAIIQSRIDCLYFGAKDPKAGAAGSVVDLFSVETFNHTVEVHAGLLESPCSQILSDFFSTLRKSKKQEDA